MPNRATAFLLFSLSVAAPCLADTAAWNTHGRVSQVRIQRGSFGGIHAWVFQQVLDTHLSPLPIEIQLSCNTSMDSTCIGLQTGWFTVPQCSWWELPAATRSALSYLLGPCAKTCNQTEFTETSGEVIRQENWGCNPINGGRCQKAYGVMMLDDRIDGILQSSGCQW